MTSIPVKTWLAESPEEIGGGERWQVLRELNAEEFAALKSGIAERGIDHALALDANGNLIDGHHRKKAWEELKSEGVEVPPVTVKQYELADPSEIRLLARKLNMQRRQLTQLEKNEVVKDQLRETWERADVWIGDDLGVGYQRVKARREELIREPGSCFTTLPEKVLARDGKEYPYEQKKRSKPTTGKPKAGAKPEPDAGPASPAGGSAEPTQTTVDEQIESAKPEAPKTITEALDFALAQGAASGGVPEDAPAWPPLPSKEVESEDAKKVRQISAWMSGLSTIKPEEAAGFIHARADAEARLVVAKEVIDWFERYRDALKAKTSQPSLRAVR
ncbi:MAG: hypothetical protein M3R38_11740 [Actinomycetota bacterium]|nr:hypothetical protein [Actinomycetota bacterium]